MPDVGGHARLVSSGQRTAVIRYLAPVTQESISELLMTIDQRISAGAARITLLIGTTGGSVFQGLCAYNYIRCLPVDVATCNLGRIESIGNVLYCAGRRRLAFAQSRFSFHGVRVGFAQGESLGQQDLASRMARAEMDAADVVSVIGTTCRKSPDEIRSAMDTCQILTSEEAVQWNLVHEVLPLGPVDASAIWGENVVRSIQDSGAMARE